MWLGVSSVATKQKHRFSAPPHDKLSMQPECPKKVHLSLHFFWKIDWSTSFTSGGGECAFCVHSLAHGCTYWHHFLTPKFPPCFSAIYLIFFFFSIPGGIFKNLWGDDLCGEILENSLWGSAQVQLHILLAKGRWKRRRTISPTQVISSELSHSVLFYWLIKTWIVLAFHSANTIFPWGTTRIRLGVHLVQ